MNLSYDFRGERHWITRHEINSIERSGPPHRIQDYADVRDGHQHGRGTFDITAEMLTTTKRLVQERPGQTDGDNDPRRVYLNTRDREFIRTWRPYATTQDLALVMDINHNVVRWVSKGQGLSLSMDRAPLDELRAAYQARTSQ